MVFFQWNRMNQILSHLNFEEVNETQQITPHDDHLYMYTPAICN